jgi:hypothetical protein
MCGFDSFYLCLLKQKTLKKNFQKPFKKTFKKTLKKTFKKNKTCKKTNHLFYLSKQSLAMEYLSSRLIDKG